MRYSVGRQTKSQRDGREGNIPFKPSNSRIPGHLALAPNFGVSLSQGGNQSGGLIVTALGMALIPPSINLV